jgi:hypothetical protein
MTSKYDRLGDHLAAIGAATIILTFAEVEAVVGPLPVEAHRSSAWWGTGSKGLYNYAHAAHWRRAGYVADRPDLAAETVSFRRVVP